MRSMTTNAVACFVGCVGFALVGDAFAAPPANLPPAVVLQNDTGEDLIKLTAAAGSCDKPLKISILAGVQDNFNLGNGPEPASPGPELLMWMSQACSNISFLFDVPNMDRCIGHTFTDLPSCVIGAQMTISLRADVGGSANDPLQLDWDSGPEDFRWGSPIADLPGAGGTWNPGQTVVVTLDLADLPSDDQDVTNILIGLEDGNLDVYVQDDTSVDFITLDLIFCDCTCPGDLNDDGSVSESDLLILFDFWGPCSPECLGDLDGNGIVNTSDLLILLANWGPCP